MTEHREAHSNQEIIGRAFRRSLAVIAVLMVVGLAVALIIRRDSGAEEIRDKQLDLDALIGTEAQQVPVMPFTDVTAAAGITWVHDNAAWGDKLLPETMGPGVAWIDADNDGDQDLFFTGSGRPGHGGPALFANDGGGRFVDVTLRAGLGSVGHGMGVATGDFDGDGRVDLYLTSVGPNRLLQNLGGRFQDVTRAAGVAGDNTWSTSAAFFDLDNDGDLDLFVCNYVVWSRDIDFEVNFTLNGTDRAYGPPTTFEGTFARLYRNEGDGTFADISAASGIEVTNPATGEPMAKALAVAVADVDRDGWLDLLVANDTVRNFLFRNRGDGTFEEIAARAGVGFDSAGNATGAMGIDLAEYRNDGRLGSAVGNFANQMTSLYVQQSDPWLFADEAIVEGLGAPSRLALTFGLFFFDADLDGRLDLLQVNGHLEPEIAEVQASQHYRQPAQLFWNAGPEAVSCFVLAPADAVGDLSRPVVGRGAAYADMDGDGDLDVVITSNGGSPLLLRNDQSLGHHWLRVRLVGSAANRQAIGAEVVLQAAGITQRRLVMPTRSYLSQVEPVLTFGLGNTDRVDSIRIRWPDGAASELESLAADQVLVVEHPAAR